MVRNAPDSFAFPVCLSSLLDVVRGDDDGGAAGVTVAVIIVVGHGGEVVPVERLTSQVVGSRVWS